MAPTEEQIQNIAVNALNTSQNKDVKVLVLGKMIKD